MVYQNSILSLELHHNGMYSRYRLGSNWFTKNLATTTKRCQKTPTWIMDCFIALMTTPPSSQLFCHNIVLPSRLEVALVKHVSMWYWQWFDRKIAIACLMNSLLNIVELTLQKKYWNLDYKYVYFDDVYIRLMIVTNRFMDELFV